MSKILFPEQKNYLEGFRIEKDELILEMEKYAAENKVPILSWQAAEFLEQLIRIKKPKRVLELGTAIGYSTIRIAKNLKKKSMIHSIERVDESIEIANGFIEQSGVGDKIEIFKGDALNVMPSLSKKYDFIFLDADKEVYATLFDYSLVLLKKGGIIFVDNLLWHGYAAAKRVPSGYKKSTKNIRDFNNIFMSHKNLISTIIPIGDGIGLGIKK
jgi:predicted O-methyltransferase YrrM